MKKKRAERGRWEGGDGVKESRMGEFSVFFT